MGLIAFCGHWPEFLIKVFKVDEFNIVLYIGIVTSCP